MRQTTGRAANQTSTKAKTVALRPECRPFPNSGEIVVCSSAESNSCLRFAISIHSAVSAHARESGAALCTLSPEKLLFRIHQGLARSNCKMPDPIDLRRALYCFEARKVTRSMLSTKLGSKFETEVLAPRHGFEPRFT